MMKFIYLLFFLLLGLQDANAQVRVSHLFVMISDAMENAKNAKTEESVPILENFKTDFYAIASHNSTAGAEVSRILEIAIKNPNLKILESLSSALLTFEKEQNPIDYAAKTKQFEKRVLPIFSQLQKATIEKNIKDLPMLYKRFYDTWQRNERIVGDISPGHYAQIETALTLYRLAMISEVVDFKVMNLQIQNIGTALREFISGNVLQAQSIEGAPQTLSEGLTLLRKAFREFLQNQDLARDYILTFITQWPIFEGEVSTRDSGLYRRIESELPEIVARGATQENLAHFENLLQSLEKLDINAQFSAFDAAIILLREGIEALLIVMALLTALQAANQSKGRAWVIGGAMLGVLLSLIMALALMWVFPLAAAGTNREILEGIVGIIAVIMMVFIGAWLHSKSSARSWKAYISNQMGKALARGSLLGLGGLAFLAVFREGAETILFYAGMMPSMTMDSFLSGFGFACLALIVIAYLMKVFVQNLPVHLIFLVMSWLIYILGFKILGVSVHALQLTNIIPLDILPLPSVAFLGFYNNLQGLLAQAIYVVITLGIMIGQRRSNAKSSVTKA
ncbi:iron permease [Helicobacter cholecystus]|uniref:Iron permease n=1 Tax=Helicobacter cholecystus TaxID=45498 RepID=A0A3D8IVL8_9HELI|nr:iron permease [Helicobacter cholecystus]VEJ25910.1 Ferrous iron uptake protein [Helicobacter cholecystus]